ncbi:MAG: hypothetical protein KKH28_10490 [Elusimicrobia bacterium]|nr:hypothetical protein [Elusimicrobiota bacterium]
MFLTGKISKVLFFAGAALAVSAFFLPVINPDLFWHLSAGRYMFEHGAVPRADFLSWTMHGRPWLDFEWLTQLLYYGLFLKGGMAALFAFKTSLLVLAVFAFFKIIKLHRSEESAFFLLPALAAGLITNSDLRPENFSVLFFVLVFWRLEVIRLKSSYRPGAAELALAAAFFALWTNLHAGYLYGAALIAFYAAGNFFEEALPFIYGRQGGIPAGKWAQYLKVLAAGVAASLINPYGARIYEVIANHQRHIAVLQEYIQEWKPFDLTNIYQWPYLALMGLAFGLTLYRFLKNRTMVYEHLIALLFFAYSSSNHARHTPFFSIAAAVCLAAMPFGFAQGGLPLSAGLPAPGLISATRHTWQAGARPVLRAAAKIAVIAVFALYYRVFVWSQYPGAARFSNYSEGLAGFLNDNAGRLSGLKMFNYWGWGGYLGFALSPGYRVFVDGRYIFHEFLEEMENSRNTPRAWETFKRKYGFELMVLDRNKTRIAVKQRFKSGREIIAWRPAYLFYLPKKEWAVIYWDMKAVVLAKRDAVAAAWLAGREYKILRPDDMNNVAAAALEGEIRMGGINEEAQRFAGQAGAPESAKNYMADWLKLLENVCREKNAKCKP